MAAPIPRCEAAKALAVLAKQIIAALEKVVLSVSRRPKGQHKGDYVGSIGILTNGLATG